MRNRLVVLGTLSVGVLTFSLVVSAQAPRGATPPSQAAGAKPADLSGDWAPDGRRGGIGQSLSISDIRGAKRGQEDDIPYQPWAREKTMSERTSTGPDPQFGNTTDPQVLYCEPPGVPHIYLWPIKTKFIQTPEAVYILHELGPFYRVVRLNSKHAEDPTRSGGETRSAGTRTETRWSWIRLASLTRRGSIRWVTRTPSSCI